MFGISIELCVIKGSSIEINLIAIKFIAVCVTSINLIIFYKELHCIQFYDIITDNKSFGFLVTKERNTFEFHDIYRDAY